MEAKHTPGPWNANWTRISGQAVGFHVAGPRHGSLRPICEAYGAMDPDEIEANARLIAAAPETAAERDNLREINAELLEALILLKQAVEFTPLGVGGIKAVEQARTAIAKATGSAA